MKLWILVSLLSSAYCLENINHDGLEITEEIVADESNYRGYLPFLENRKFERGNYGDVNDNVKDAPKNNDQKYIDPLKEENKEDDKFRVNRGPRGMILEFLTNFLTRTVIDDWKNKLCFVTQTSFVVIYFLVAGYCIGEYRYKDEYDNNYRNRDDVNNRNDRFYSNNIDDGIKERCDKLFGYTGPTGNLTFNLVLTKACDSRYDGKFYDHLTEYQKIKCY